MTATYQRIVLASRPQGWVTAENFRLERVPVPVPGPGQVLVRNHYLSLDPYMRGRMEESKSYAESQKLGETMIGGTVGVVEASNNPGFAAGDTVLGMFGWQEYGLSDGTGLMKVDTRAVPMSAYLGAVGMPGVTAWYGLNRICRPKAGETVLVSAASGAVGSVVGQLAKLAGCRAIGIAGGQEKCEYVVSELGFDACIDHRRHGDLKSMTRALLVGIATWIGVAAMISYLWCPGSRTLACTSDVLLVTGIVGGGPLLVAVLVAGFVVGTLLLRRVTWLTYERPPPKRAE